MKQTIYLWHILQLKMNKEIIQAVVVIVTLTLRIQTKANTVFTNGKKDIPVNNDKFTGIFSDPPENMRLI